MTDAFWPNAVWQALTGPQAALAQGSGRPRRYDSSVAPFAALPDDPTERDWDDLAGLAAGQSLVVFRLDPDVPADWTVAREFPTFQMVAGELPAEVPGTELIESLTIADVPEMLALTALTDPGPFLERTIELGTYLGIRVDGQLVAMAGERFRPPGATEISAVCTHPEYRGHGFARALVAVLVDRIRSRGETPFLHVVQTNPAKRVYDGLGFRVCLEPTALLLEPPPIGSR